MAAGGNRFYRSLRCSQPASHRQGSLPLFRGLERRHHSHASCLASLAQTTTNWSGTGGQGTRPQPLIVPTNTLNRATHQPQVTVDPPLEPPALPQKSRENQALQGLPRSAASRVQHGDEWSPVCHSSLPTSLQRPHCLFPNYRTTCIKCCA